MRPEVLTREAALEQAKTLARESGRGAARPSPPATDTAKRQLFDRLASHLIVLADQVEQEMLKRKP
jgi:hypothetical protein